MVLMTMTMGKRVYAGFRYGEGTGERGHMVEEDLDEGRWTTISGTQQHQHPATSKKSVFESLYQQRRQAASLTRCFSFRASISATVSFFLSAPEAGQWSSIRVSGRLCMVMAVLFFQFFRCVLSEARYARPFRVFIIVQGPFARVYPSRYVQDQERRQPADAH
jgi:hypothetical protein